jgi:hypothetical protein
MAYRQSPFLWIITFFEKVCKAKFYHWTASHYLKRPNVVVGRYIPKWLRKYKLILLAKTKCISMPDYALTTDHTVPQKYQEVF